MILNNLVKLEIHQFYHFNDNAHSDNFIIDFKDEVAYWNPQYFKDYQFDQDRLSGWYEGSPIEYKGHDLFFMLHNRITKEIFVLEDENIKEFINFIEESELLNQLLEWEFDIGNNQNIPKDIFESFCTLKENNRDKLHRIHLVNDCFITINTEEFEIHFLVNFSFPELWADFSNSLEKLIGFDVLNINNSKYWINNINYKLCSDGFFDKNGKKLILEKFNFNFHTWGFNYYPNFSIDFNENLLIFKRFREIISSEKLTQNILDDFKKLIIKHGIYLWGCEESYENVLNSKSMWLDGYHWNIELIFNNGAIFYVGLDNEHPDSYFRFAKDVKQLFGRDLFRIKDCHYPE